MAGGLIEMVVGPKTLGDLASKQWDADILFRCMWGNPAWLNQLAARVLAAAPQQQFLALRACATELNGARLSLAHPEDLQSLNAASGFRSGRLVVLKLLQQVSGLFKGLEGAAGAAPCTGVTAAGAAAIHTELQQARVIAMDLLPEAGGAVQLDGLQLSSLAMPLCSAGH